MPAVPSIRGERVVRALEKAGFTVARVAGSHHIMRHPDGRGTTVSLRVAGRCRGPALPGEADCGLTCS